MLEALAFVSANLETDGAVVGAGFGEGATAPAMMGMADFVGFRGFDGEGRDEHFFRPEISASGSGVHNQAVSCISVR
jgi:hypothetical protein